MHNLPIQDEIDFLFQTVNQCREQKTGSDGIWQIAPFFCSIPFRKASLLKLEKLKVKLKAKFPELMDFAERRSVKAFKNQNDTITKPSYIGRLRNYKGKSINQISNIESIFAREPASGGLVFSIFDPEDLAKRFRPGYVPCIVSGSFLKHEDEIQLNVFFRSQSVIEFGLFDLLFLRRFQEEVIASFNEVCGLEEAEAVSMGALNMHFARIMIHRRIGRNRHGFIRRDEIIEDWLNVVEEEKNRI